ncbi:MAG: 2-oxoglutarate dehydrogenase E1 subunit family protein, partial [Mycobacteriales bacterium]
MAEQSTSTTFGSEFGANEWLVEEMYERYVADPNSVDSAWHEFFADYQKPPGKAPRPRGSDGTAPSTATTSGGPGPDVSANGSAPIRPTPAPSRP